MTISEISWPNLLARPLWNDYQGMFEQQFSGLFSAANFIFGIYYSTHTKENDWQDFCFIF